MGLSGILLYCARAAAFALPAGAVWLGGRLIFSAMQRRKIRWKREFVLLLTVLYFAALLQITVWRGGVNWEKVFSDAGRSAQLTLLKTTRSHWRAGLWMFTYHAVGNMAWFVPMGALLPMVSRRWRFSAVVLAGMCVSAGIEIAQWILRTGVTDIDDVLFNALGAGAGFVLYKCFCVIKKLANK